MGVLRTKRISLVSWFFCLAITEYCEEERKLSYCLGISNCNWGEKTEKNGSFGSRVLNRGRLHYIQSSIRVIEYFFWFWG